jgi:Amidohydrolase
MNQKIIDIHCHMFNLKYLPVAGIIVRYGEGKVSPRIARGIEWLLLRKTDSDFESMDEMFKKLNAPPRVEEPIYHLLNSEKLRDPKHIMNYTEVDLVTAMSNMVTTTDLNNTPLSEALEEFISSNGGPQELLVQPMSQTSNTETYWLNVFGWLRKLLNWLVNVAEKIKNYIKWFLFMTRSEISIYKYFSNEDGQGVSQFVHHMMDVDSFFDHSSYFDFETRQVENMQKLNDYAAGKLIGFVAFNPKQPNWKNIIDDAINNKGFKGVKFYPPIGYKADGDPAFAPVIEELFDHCDKKRIPLFTHCNNQGFEAQPGNAHSGYNSNPVFWEKALIKRPNLILCLAHGGGVEGWFTENRPGDIYSADQINANNISNESQAQRTNWNASYAAMVFKLCVKYPYVYTDAAYLDEMILPGGGFNETPRKNFKRRLLNIFAKAPEFANKIMYGSDWHMLFQEGTNYVYLQDYLAFFKDKEFDPYRDRFFYDNAISYLSSK